MLSPRSYLFTRSSSSSTTDFNHAENKAERKSRPAATSKQEKGMPTSTVSFRSATPSSPVVIPTTQQASRSRKEHRNSRTPTQQPDPLRRGGRTIHSPDAIPPSVAALLAITSIPPPRSNVALRIRSGASQRLTVDAILQHTSESEKESGMSLRGKNALDFLLGLSDDLEEDVAESDNGQESVMSSRTLSSLSMPSLDDESIGEMSPSFDSIVTPGSRGRRSLPSRRLQSLSNESDDVRGEDPLSTQDIDVDELDFRVFQRSRNDGRTSTEHIPAAQEDTELPRLKSAFKSNLTASLRALRSAAKSISSLKAPMITPDDFLTRSIISIDPGVPFTDERMPPLLQDTPTPALRRYLNPTTNAPIEAHVPSSFPQSMSTPQCTASIQMQTYKTSHSNGSTSPTVISLRTQSTSEEAIADVTIGPVARQRDMRENSDFIRIAVMEMAMRKKGKLDDQKPGRARWALPPRKPPTRPYEIGENGVPVRWIAVTH